MLYRVVKKMPWGFFAQFSPKWFPFWINCYRNDDCSPIYYDSLEEAKAIIKKHHAGTPLDEVVYMIDGKDLS